MKEYHSQILLSKITIVNILMYILYSLRVFYWVLTPAPLSWKKDYAYDN